MIITRTHWVQSLFHITTIPDVSTHCQNIQLVKVNYASCVKWVIANIHTPLNVIPTNLVQVNVGNRLVLEWKVNVQTEQTEYDLKISQ